MVGLVGVVRQFACRWSSRVESESARNLVIAHPRWVGLGLQWIDLEGDGDQRQYKNEEKKFSWFRLSRQNAAETVK
jgi:hypothetical protein